jgi:hypothetical protein
VSLAHAEFDMVNGCHMLLISLIAACIGCAMCDSGLDRNYAAYGGVRDRMDRVDGRVGSILGPAAAQDLVDRSGEEAFETFVPPSTPTVDDDREQYSPIDDDQPKSDLLRKLEELGGELLELPEQSTDDGGI